jgi:xylulokinase
MSSFLVGVDIGTTGTKAAIVDADGRLVADAYDELKLHCARPGWVEQYPKDFYRSAIKTIRQTMKKSRINPGDVAAIAFSGQMAGVSTIDKNWMPVTHYDSWLDVRCEPLVDHVRNKCEELVIRTVGAPPSIAHGPKILWWKKEKPRVFQRIHKFIMPAVYVAGRLASLSGDEAYQDHSYLHFSGFADARRLKWSDELCEIFDVPLDKFPKIVKPWEIVGELNSREAKECGLVKGTPIAAGAGDTAVSSLGAGIVEAGMAFDIAGTASVFSTCVDKFVPDTKYKTMYLARSVIPDLWYPQAYLGGGGLCLRWFRDEIAAEERALALQQKRDAYQVLDAAAKKIPLGSDYLLCIPHLGGKVYPYDPKVRGGWFGFSWSHKKAHLYRSILEAVAYEYGHYLRILKDLYPEVKFTQVRAVGGGARSDFWNQLKADVLGIPYARLNRPEFSVLGLAVIAGYSVGVFKDIKSTIRRFVRPVRRIEPRLRYHRYYEQYIQLYMKLSEALQGCYAEMFEISTRKRPTDPG